MNIEMVRRFASDAARHLAVGDASSTRTVYGIVIALAAIGAALIFLAVWLIRQTRPDPELLAPLERMDDRSWRKQDPAQRRRSLDDERPEGADPLRREQQVPELDAEFDQAKPAVANFDDLQAQQQAERRRANVSEPTDSESAANEAVAVDASVDMADAEPATADDTGELDADADGFEPIADADQHDDD